MDEVHGSLPSLYICALDGFGEDCPCVLTPDVHMPAFIVAFHHETEALDGFLWEGCCNRGQTLNDKVVWIDFSC